MQGIVKKGIAQGMEELVVREGTVEENIAAESIADEGGVQEGMALVREEIIREQIEKCMHKLSPGFLQVTRILTDMSECSNLRIMTQPSGWDPWQVRGGVT